MLNSNWWLYYFQFSQIPSNLEKILFSHNNLNFGISRDKIQQVLWRIQNLNFSNNSSIKYIFILWRTNNLDHNLPEKFVNGMILSGISAKKQYHNASVVLIPLLTCDKKKSIRRRNINITSRLLEEESGKRDLFFEI